MILKMSFTFPSFFLPSQIVRCAPSVRRMHGDNAWATDVVVMESTADSPSGGPQSIPSATGSGSGSMRQTDVRARRARTSSSSEIKLPSDNSAQTANETTTASYYECVCTYPLKLWFFFLGASSSNF